MSSMSASEVAVIPGAGSAALSPQSYGFLQRFIYGEAGIVVEAGKEYLFETRLLPLLRREKIASIESLCAKLALRSSPGLVQQVVEAMTTHETFFFRDAGFFDALRDYVLPAIMRRPGGSRPWRIWSAAASTGQEAYSLAMMLLEMKVAVTQVEIVGTDISEKVLERAREGRYVQFEMSRGLPSQYLLRYFVRSGLDWRVRDELRAMVKFKTFDLRKDFGGMGRFDLVLCRNVLIYFDLETRRKLLASMRGILQPGGMVALGSAETLLNLDCGLHRKSMGGCAFYAAQKEDV